MLTLFRPKLTLSSPYVGPMVAYVAIASANPHSSDRNDGGDRNGGGRDGVGRGWERGGNDSVGGRGDRPYNGQDRAKLGQHRADMGQPIGRFCYLFDPNEVYIRSYRCKG